MSIKNVQAFLEACVSGLSKIHCTGCTAQARETDDEMQQPQRRCKQAQQKAKRCLTLSPRPLPVYPLLPAEPSPADAPGGHYGRPSASTPVHPILSTFAEIMKNCFKGLSLCVVLIQYTHMYLDAKRFRGAIS